MLHRWRADTPPFPKITVIPFWVKLKQISSIKTRTSQSWHDYCCQLSCGLSLEHSCPVGSCSDISVVRTFNVTALCFTSCLWLETEQGKGRGAQSWYCHGGMVQWPFYALTNTQHTVLHLLKTMEILSPPPHCQTLLFQGLSRSFYIKSLYITRRFCASKCLIANN